MGIERVMHYECRVCGRKIDVTRTGDVYEEPVYCCGLEATEEVSIPVTTAVPAPAVRKKGAKKKAAKKKAAKKAKKKAVMKKASKKKATKTKKKTAKKKAQKKASKKRR